MSATSALRDEHSYLIRVLLLMSSVAALAQHDVRVSLRQFTEASKLLESFSASHEEKEEELLFPAVMGSDAPVVFGVMGRLVSQHGQSRIDRLHLIELLRSSSAGNLPPELPGLLQRYSEDTQIHVALEEQECFDVADRALFPEVQEFLALQYEEVDRRRLGEVGVARLDWVIAELESEAGAATRR